MLALALAPDPLPALALPAHPLILPCPRSNHLCSNVLLSEDWRAKVSDLGMAQVLAGSARLAVGFSRVYAAPEQLMGQRCTLAADM